MFWNTIIRQTLNSLAKVGFINNILTQSPYKTILLGREAISHSLSLWLFRASSTPSLSFVDVNPSTSSYRSQHPSQALRPRVLLLEDLPPLNSSSLISTFRASILSYLSNPLSDTPLIVIISDTISHEDEQSYGGGVLNRAMWGEGNINAWKVLGAEIMGDAATVEIKWILWSDLLES